MHAQSPFPVPRIYVYTRVHTEHDKGQRSEMGVATGLGTEEEAP